MEKGAKLGYNHIIIIIVSRAVAQQCCILLHFYSFDSWCNSVILRYSVVVSFNFICSELMCMEIKSRIT